MKRIIMYALLHAGGTALYVAFVASAMFYAPAFLSKTPTVLAPIALLLLFVFSAAVTGLLVFGRPIIWYVEGKKHQALSLLLVTLGVLFIILCLVFVVLSQGE